MLVCQKVFRSTRVFVERAGDVCSSTTHVHTHTHTHTQTQTHTHTHTHIHTHTHTHTHTYTHAHTHTHTHTNTTPSPPSPPIQTDTWCNQRETHTSGALSARTPRAGNRSSDGGRAVTSRAKTGGAGEGVTVHPEIIRFFLFPPTLSTRILVYYH